MPTYAVRINRPHAVMLYTHSGFIAVFRKRGSLLYETRSDSESRVRSVLGKGDRKRCAYVEGNNWSRFYVCIYTILTSYTAEGARQVRKRDPEPLDHSLSRGRASRFRPKKAIWPMKLLASRRSSSGIHGTSRCIRAVLDCKCGSSSTPYQYKMRPMSIENKHHPAVYSLANFATEMFTSTRTARTMALVAVASQISCVSSMIVPFRRQTSSSSSNSNPFNFNVVDPSGDGNIIYAANITIDGQSFEVCVCHSALVIVPQRIVGSTGHWQFRPVDQHSGNDVH